jgi:hypothetical protein
MGERRWGWIAGPDGKCILSLILPRSRWSFIAVSHRGLPLPFRDLACAPERRAGAVGEGGGVTGEFLVRQIGIGLDHPGPSCMLTGWLYPISWRGLRE